MAPKKKAASGPTAQEVEDEWKQKESIWMQEEKQLEYFAKLMQDDARHYRMRSRELAVDVEALTSRSQFLESKSADLRIQFKKMSKSIAEQQGTEMAVMAQQEGTLQEMNDGLQMSRSELLALNAAFETTAVENADKVQSVAFRTSGIAALREKVMKLRNERAHVQAELLALRTATSALQCDPRRSPFMKKPSHCIVVSPSPCCASLAMLSKRLRDTYGFDVTQYHPTAADCSPASDVASQRSETGASSSSMQSLAFGEPCIATFTETVHSGNNNDTSTRVMRHLHALLWSAARGAFGDARRIVVLVGTLSPATSDDADKAGGTGHLDSGICFPLTVGGEASSDGKAVVLSLRDVLDVLLLRQLPSASLHPPNSLVAIELVSRDLTERHIIIVAEARGAEADGDGASRFVTTILRYKNTSCANTSENTQVVPNIGGGGSSLVGMQLIKILEDDVCRGGGGSTSSMAGMSSLELSHRLSMRLLESGAPSECVDVTREDVPMWLSQLLTPRTTSQRASGSSSDDGSSMRLLPPPRPAPPVHCTEQQIDVSFFVPDFARDVAPPPAAGDCQAQLLALCNDAVAAVPCIIDGCALTDSTMAFPDPESRSVLHYFVVGAVSVGHFMQELQSAVKHHMRLGYGLELNTEAEKELLLGKGPGPLNVTCVAEAEGCFVVKIATAPTVNTHAGQGNSSTHQRTSFRTALAMPASLRGSDRAAFVAHPGASVSICKIVEEHVVHGFPSGDVRVIGLVEAHLTATVANNKVADFLTALELMPRGLLTKGPIAPALTPRHAFLPLSRAKFCDSLHWRQLQGTTAAQQIIVLIVTAPSDTTSSAPDHRHPRSLFEDQREEIHAATQLINACLPQQIVASCTFLHVSLADLQCTPSDRDAIMDGSTMDAGPFLEKKAVWRNIMSLFSPRVGDFITRVSYPCAIVTCPSMSPLEHTHAIVIPRSMETRRSQTRADCLFKGTTLASAIDAFYRLVLRTTAESSSALKGLAAKLDEGEDLDASFDNSVGKPGLFSISEQLPSTWFPV